MTGKLRVLALFFGGLLVVGCHRQPNLPGESRDYRAEMRAFVAKISAAARGARPGFVVVAQDGLDLLTENGEPSGKPAQNYVRALDGVGQEDVYFGYSGIGVQTPEDARRRYEAFLDLARDHGLRALVTDYCATCAQAAQAGQWAAQRGYVEFAADSRDLDDIPSCFDPLPGENDRDVTRLSEVRNFLYLINPHKFSSRQQFVETLASTNYDMLILDYSFNGESYASEDLARLKRKANGGRRLVISYMSIGEAEDYRFYWRSEWKKSPPAWLLDENPEWPGNYTVRYWYPQWQSIIVDSTESFLGRILRAGFDGVYLDKVDVYEVFEGQD
ncbi:MAG TPA: hypothetical protein ENK07_08500 [Bacteroidetes bacterium]|nr:hypothetical protein [Bacteroidota bacterium]